jgi:DNA-binding NarL/FixJ family response regulator
MIVLVVDDSPPVRARLVAMMSEGPGVEVLEAGDAAEALAALASTAIDVVILDLHLPRSSGLQLLTQIKATEPGVTVVVLTNDASSQHRRECLLRGADHFFDKSHHFAAAAELVVALAPAIDTRSGSKTRLP